LKKTRRRLARAGEKEQSGRAREIACLYSRAGAASLQHGKGERAEEREKRGEGGENRANLEFGGAPPASSSPSARPPILLRPTASLRIEARA